MIPPDKYDEAITYLTENPEQIKAAWISPHKHPAGCIFEYACRGELNKTPWHEDIGCLTTIRNKESGMDQAQTPELRLAIQSDERIPLRQVDITVADLPVFAEWQRRLDKELCG